MIKKITACLSLALLSGAMLLTFFGSSACGGGDRNNAAVYQTALFYQLANQQSRITAP